ncbi:DUF3617 domain-containing protein [Rugamonas sp.]|uniref:DUF3617 domain-containing protein n=1 Tax=Rugamonas sp. TaxID=1926287 RepID=UPI0025EEEEA4|nr:DUF3617 domain-containing protein [Rugamonas sp.]
MKRLFALALVAAPLLAASASTAAQSMRPGQWEMSNKMNTSNVETNQAMQAMLKQLANLPPEQRAKVEAMMAQNGATMPKLAPNGGISVSACITAEMAKRQEVPTGQQGNCKSNNQPVTGGMNLSFICTNPASSGQGHLTFAGDTAFTMTMDVTTEARGKPEQMTIETSGRWLGACNAAH